MTDQAMSTLSRRMIEDMTIRKLAPKTQHDYLQRVKNFTAYLGRSPDTASSEDVRRYQLHLTASGVGVPTVNQQAGVHAHAAAQLRHPPARAEHRYQSDPGAARKGDILPANNRLKHAS